MCVRETKRERQREGGREGEEDEVIITVNLAARAFMKPRTCFGTSSLVFVCVYVCVCCSIGDTFD